MTRPADSERISSSAGVDASGPVPELDALMAENDGEKSKPPDTGKKRKAEEPDEDITQALVQWDVLLAGLTMILLVIVASAPVRNSDIWLHLAAGKQILRGQTTPGADPFTYTGNDARFVNHTWLFDAATYTVYSRLGDTALVAIGVLLIAAVIAVSIQAGQTTNRLLGKLACAGLTGAVAIWLYYDLRNLWIDANLGDYRWVVFSKMAALFVFLLIAGKIGNWSNSNRRLFAIGASVMAIGTCVWLGQDLGYSNALILALKILMLALLFIAWLRHSPGENTLWWPTFSAFAAIFAMMPWLEFQSSLVSFLFLPLLWLLLEKGAAKITVELSIQSSNQPKFSAINALRAYWPVLAVMVLWVNLDSWFLLGLLTIALYGLGRVMDAEKSKLTEAVSMGLVLIGSLGVCLINPSHINVFALPPELALVSSEQVQNDAMFSWLTVAPWHVDYFWSSNLPVPAGIAYWTMVVLGNISFLLNLRQWSWTRALVWYVFLLPSLFVGLMIPFFAVITIPIMSLNFIEFLQSRLGPANGLKGTMRSWIVLVRPLTTLGILLAAVMAWAGFRQNSTGLPYWAIQPEADLVNAAKKIHIWRSDGTFAKDARGLSVSLAASDYMAWHCPEEKNHMNSRLRTADFKTRDFFTVRRALFGALPNSRFPVDDALGPVRRIFRDEKITHLIIHSKDSIDLQQAFFRLYERPKEWPLLYIEGRTAIFGWRDVDDPKNERAFADIQIDLERMAFRNTSVKNCESWIYPVFVDRFTEPMPPISSKREEAVLHLARFRRSGLAYVKQSRRKWQIMEAVGLVGGMAPCGAGPSLSDTAMSLGLRNSDVTLRAHLFPAYMFSQDNGPVSAILLAIRSARQAVLDNPRDAEAWYALGQAYFTLSRETRERKWVRRYLNLGRLRTMQAVAAFKQSLRFQDLAGSHLALAGIYGSMGYLDMSLVHHKELLRLTRAKGPLPNESSVDFQFRIDDLKSRTEELQELVNEALANYSEKHVNLVQPLRKANLAGQLGLPGKALEILLSTNIANFGIEGTKMELQLLLSAGSVLEVNDWIKPQAEKFRDNLGPKEYHWLQIQLAAAMGDYDRAQSNIQEISSGDPVDAIGQTRNYLSVDIPFKLRKVLEQRAQPHLLPLIPEPLEEVVKHAEEVIKSLQHLADHAVLSGVLLLEAGKVDKAERRFRGALTIWKGIEASPSVKHVDFAARPIAEGYLQLIQNGRRNQRR